MREIWKDILNYEGKYQVSNLGNVRALNYHRENKTRLLIPKVDKYGYLVVALYKNKIRKNYLVHRLVMSAFVGKSNLTVNHKDENKQNNKLENLEYMTTKDNVRYSQAIPIKAINTETGEELYFKSIKSVKEKGFSQGNVWNCLNGKYKQTKGYKFHYINL